MTENELCIFTFYLQNPLWSETKQLHCSQMLFIISKCQCEYFLALILEVKVQFYET